MGLSQFEFDRSGGNLWGCRSSSLIDQAATYGVVAVREGTGFNLRRMGLKLFWSVAG